MDLIGTLRGTKYVVGSIWHDRSNRDERLHRLIAATGWQVWKRAIKKPVTHSLFNGMQFRAYPDCTVSSSTFYSRIPNFQHIEFVRRYLNGGTLVDVGANVGLFTLLLADKIEHAVLFEPNPLAAVRAKENLKLNALEFPVCELALSDEAGMVTLENTGGVSTVNRTVVGFTTSVPTINVQRTTLDQFLDENNPRKSVSVVKIDVEGHENSVLRGMSKCLKTARPLVMFEYLGRTNLAESFEIFARANYRVIVLEEGRATWADRNVTPLQDLFACPAEFEEKFIV